MNTELQDLALRYKCPYCQVDPGEWCRTTSGNTGYMLHSLRTDPIYNAYGLGYIECDDHTRRRARSAS